MAELAKRWDILPVDAVAQAVAESPDGLIHAGLSSDQLTLCERMGDAWLGGSPCYVRLNIDLPSASGDRKCVSCPSCLEVMHS